MDASAIIDILQPLVPGAALEAGTSVDFADDLRPGRSAGRRRAGRCATHPSLGFNVLVEMTAADYLPREPRFEVVYHLLSIPNEAASAAEGARRPATARVPTVQSVWRGAGLARARSLGHVRHRVRRPRRPAAAADARGLGRASRRARTIRCRSARRRRPTSRSKSARKSSGRTSSAIASSARTETRWLKSAPKR